MAEEEKKEEKVEEEKKEVMEEEVKEPQEVEIEVLKRCFEDDSPREQMRIVKVNLNSGAEGFMPKRHLQR